MMKLNQYNKLVEEIYRRGHRTPKLRNW